MEDKKEELKKKTNTDEGEKQNNKNMEKADEIIEIKKQMASMKAEIEEKDDRYKRIMAEFENYKKKKCKRKRIII